MKEHTQSLQNRAMVVVNPMIAANRSAEVTLSKFLRVLQPHYGQILVIGGNVTVEPDLTQITVLSEDIQRAGNKLKRAVDIFLCQWKLARCVKKHGQKDMPVYFWVADKMLLPYRAAKSRGMDIRYFLYGNVMKEGTPGRFQKISGKLIAYMASHADSICVESPGVLQEWAGTVTPKQTRTIHLYTGIRQIMPPEEKRKVIGMLCRLTEGKHVLESMEAFARFREEHPGYCLEIIGSGRQEAACRQRIRELDAQSYIHLKGWVEHADIPKHTAHWQYLLFPTDTEGMPNSVIEMMGQGVPAIASPVGGIRDLIRHGENGFLLQGTGPEDILSGLRTAVAEKNRYEEISESAWQTIRETMSLHRAREQAKQEIQE